MSCCKDLKTKMCIPYCTDFITKMCMPYRIPLFQGKYTIEMYLCSISEKIISLTKVRRIKLIVCFQARAEPYYLI